MSGYLLRFENYVLETYASDSHPSLKRLLSGSAGGKRIRLLDIPNLLVENEDRICVVGRNGNGKTTLMRAIAGIYKPTFGEITGKFRATTVLASGIGLDDDLNVLENIKYSLLMADVPLREIHDHVFEILEFCEISALEAQKLYKYFSTGFKSRISFAIATFGKPDLLLLDEVLGGGDKVFMKKAQTRVENLIQSARGAIIATHGPNEMVDVCNKLLLMESGKIAFFGDFSKGLTRYNDLMSGRQ